MKFIGLMQPVPCLDGWVLRPEKNKLCWQKTTYMGLMHRAFCNHYLMLFWNI